MSDSLKERGKSLEDAFFKQKEAKQIEGRRKKIETEEAKQLEGDRKKIKLEELAASSGLDNVDALTLLVELGVTPDTIAAIALVPLVHVAWADGELQDSERKAILEAADEKGIKTDSAAYELLGSWLEAKPSAELFTAWTTYIKALVDVVDDKALAELKKSIAGFARDIAKSAGGFIGLKSVSKAEERALAEVEAAFP